MRLIDADKFESLLCKAPNEHASLRQIETHYALKWVMERLDEQNTVDAVPVIRCKDCKWSLLHTPNRCRCHLLDWLGCEECWVSMDGYCDRAEPREEND